MTKQMTKKEFIDSYEIIETFISKRNIDIETMEDSNTEILETIAYNISDKDSGEVVFIYDKNPKNLLRAIERKFNIVDL